MFRHTFLIVLPCEQRRKKMSVVEEERMIGEERKVGQACLAPARRKRRFLLILFVAVLVIGFSFYLLYSNSSGSGVRSCHASSSRFTSIDGRNQGGCMATEDAGAIRRRRRRRTDEPPVDYGPAPPEVHPSIVALRGRHRAAHPDLTTLYMLRSPTIPPTTYYPHAPGERLMREHILDTQDIFSAYFGRDMDSDFQHSINTYEELCRKLNKDMHISDSRYRDADEASSSYAASQSSQPHATGFDGGPSSMPDVGPYTYPYNTPAPYSSQEGMFSPFQSWQAAGSSMYPHPSVYMPQMHPVYPIVPFQPGPSQEISDVTPLDDTEQTTDQAEDVQHQQHHLRDRPRRPPAHYTPGSDALPPRRHRRH